MGSWCAVVLCLPFLLLLRPCPGPSWLSGCLPPILFLGLRAPQNHTLRSEPQARAGWARSVSSTLWLLTALPAPVPSPPVLLDAGRPWGPLPPACASGAMSPCFSPGGSGAGTPSLAQLSVGTVRSWQLGSAPRARASREGALRALGACVLGGSCSTLALLPWPRPVTVMGFDVRFASTCLFLTHA